RRRLPASHADAREWNAVHRGTLRQAARAQPQERVLGARLVYVRRAPPRPLALRLARARRAALDHRRHRVRLPRLPRQQVRARGFARPLADRKRLDDIPLNTLGVALAVLLAIAGFFSIAETA